MRVGFVRVNADAGPHIGLALRHGDDIAPLALPRGDVEEAGDAALARVFKDFGLALDQSFVIEVTMAVDQPQAASSSSSGSSRRGNRGVGCGIGAPPSPASIKVRSLSAASGTIGAMARVSSRTAATSVPSTAAMRSGSVLRSVQGACVST